MTNIFLSSAEKIESFRPKPLKFRIFYSFSGKIRPKPSLISSVFPFADYKLRKALSLFKQKKAKRKVHQEIPRTYRSKGSDALLLKCFKEALGQFLRLRRW